MTQFLDFDNNDRAATWIDFTAQAAVDNVTSNTPLKWLF